MIRLLILALAFVAVTAHTSRAQGTLNLRDADLRAFVEIVSETMGRNFILDPRVRGTVTVFAPANVSTSAMYEIFLNVLELNRLTIVEGRDADRIVPLDIARELATPDNRMERGGAYETRVYELRNSPLAEAVEVIRPLLPQEAVLSTVPAARLLILSDRKENHARIARLIERLDQPRAQSIETIRLRDGNAVDMLNTLQSLEITPVGASLSADARANTVIVSGDDDFRQRIRNLISQLDTPQRSYQTAVVRLNYADARQLEPVVARSFGAGAPVAEAASGVGPIAVVADAQSNSLVITAPSDRIDSIVASVRALDTRPSQVLIEAVIFELSVEDFSDLTVQFAAILNNVVAGGVEFNLAGRPSLSSVISAAVAGTPVSPGIGGSIGGGYRNDGDGFVGFLSALVSQTSTQLLSTPSIMTLNNTEAQIVVAQNVPFVTGSFAQVGESAIPNQPFQTIKREDVGLTLRVLPQVTGDGNVRLAITQEVSNLTNTASAAGGEITNKRTLNTNVLVGNGRVIMLGGLLENGSRSVNQGVPGLQDLPVLGGLFRGKNVNKNQKVLLVLLRPHIVTSDNQAEQLTRRVSSDARRASVDLQAVQKGRFPEMPDGTLPFDGVNLNLPFDVDVIDPVGRSRNLPPLPSPLTFN
jgi:general secretion pathway protein D